MTQRPQKEAFGFVDILKKNAVFTTPISVLARKIDNPDYNLYFPTPVFGEKHFNVTRVVLLVKFPQHYIHVALFFFKVKHEILVTFLKITR